MIKILGGIGTSHVPSIGATIDNKRTKEPYWQPLFNGVIPAQQWLAEQKPDICIIVYNDHASRIGLDMVPTFAIGTGEEFHSHDEGFGPRPVPVAQGAPQLAWHLLESLIYDEFDMTTLNDMTIDHGMTVPMSLMFGEVPAWPCKFIPLVVNVIQFPPPTARRCLKLGQAIRRALLNYQGHEKVVIFGTGGLSHQLQGERAGLTNIPYDKMWLDKLSDDPEYLANISHYELMREAGSEGIEAIMWLIMRGALGDKVREKCRFQHVPVSNTAYGMIVLEPQE